MKNLIVRTITGVLFVVTIVACFLEPTAMVFLFALVTGLTVWEFCTLVNDRRPATTVNRFITTAAAVYLFIAMAGYCSGITPGSSVFIPYLLTLVYLFVSELYLKQADPINDWACTMLAQLYIALPFSCVNALAFTIGDEQIAEFNTWLPLSVFIFLWTNDTGAYCCGSLFGRHPLFPRISPKKSWEGSIGGGIFVLIAAAIISYAVPDTGLSLLQWLGLGLVVCIFGTWGDLVESLFKRTIGVKDSGNILPGHGGMLDRFDSSLMALPAAVIYIFTLSLI